mmetsp:Transcript_3406/g.7071  ORF Transcript_3406/g.7071 Transcript_3406/m.7071 type:complete len:384 (-) Transcript_3406:2271-3422(-)
MEYAELRDSFVVLVSAKLLDVAAGSVPPLPWLPSPLLREAVTSRAVASPAMRLSILASYSSLALLMLLVMASIVAWACPKSSSRFSIRRPASSLSARSFWSAFLASPMAASAWSISFSRLVTFSRASFFSIPSTIIWWLSSSFSSWTLNIFDSCSFLPAAYCFRSWSMSLSAFARSFFRSFMRPSAAFFSSKRVSMAALASSMAPSASETSSSRPRILSIASFLAEESSSMFWFISSFSSLSRSILFSRPFRSPSISLSRLSMFLSRSARSFSVRSSDSDRSFRSAMSLSITCEKLAVASSIFASCSSRSMVSWSVNFLMASFASLQSASKFWTWAVSICFSLLRPSFSLWMASSSCSSDWILRSISSVVLSRSFSRFSIRCW